jgi:CO/xanthine dehydrogenase Mo-binding subunit
VVRNFSLPATIDSFKQGDAEAALAKVVTTIEAEYRCRYAYHAQIEPLNAVASVSAAGNAAEVWCGTQYPAAALAAAVRALGSGDKLEGRFRYGDVGCDALIIEARARRLDARRSHPASFIVDYEQG